MKLGRDAVEVRPAAGEEEVSEALELRLRVFSGEQGIAREAELDGLDPEALHIVALRRGEPVGTCRLRFPGGTCKLERMAVEVNLRGRGLGRRLVEAAERAAAERGAGEVVLHAQRQVEGFYAACGFATRGETFLEEGIPHIQMRKGIAAGPAPG
jgi:predicted GNAT family N-acyltransferase